MYMLTKELPQSLRVRCHEHCRQGLKLKGYLALLIASLLHSPDAPFEYFLNSLSSQGY